MRSLTLGIQNSSISRSNSPQRRFQKQASRLANSCNGGQLSQIEHHIINQQSTPLIMAAERQNISNFIKYYSQYAQVSQVNKFMYNLMVNGLHWNCQMKLPHLLYALDITGKSLLHYCIFGQKDIQEDYCFNQIVPKLAGKQDNQGRTALMFAAQFGQYESCKILCKQEIGLCDNKGQSAIFYAAKYGNLRIVDLLMEYEGLILDKQGFQFHEFFPNNQSSVMLNQSQQLINDFSRLKQQSILDSETVQQDLPDFHNLFDVLLKGLDTKSQQFISLVDEMKVNILKFIDPNLAIVTKFIDHQLSKFLPQYQLDIQEYLRQQNDYLSTLSNLNKQQMTWLKVKINDQLDEYLVKIYQVRHVIRVDIVPMIKEINLLILQQFEKTKVKFDLNHSDYLNFLKRTESQYSQIVTQVNTIAFFSPEYSNDKAHCTRCFDQIVQEVQVLQSNSSNYYYNLVEILGQHVADIFEKKLKLCIEDFVNLVQSSEFKLKGIINSKALKRVERIVIVEIQQQMKHTGKNLQSVYPEQSDIVEWINSSINTILNKCSKVLKISIFKRLIQLANDYFRSEKGLFRFISDNNLLPFKGNWTSLQNIQDYFELYPSQADTLAVQEVIDVMKLKLSFMFTKEIANLFKEHICDYFLNLEVPDIFPPRTSSIEDQRKWINSADKEIQKTILELLCKLFYSLIFAEKYSIQVDDSYPVSLLGSELKQLIVLGVNLPKSILAIEPEKRYKCIVPKLYGIFEQQEFCITAPYWLPDI